MALKIPNGKAFFLQYWPSMVFAGFVLAIAGYSYVVDYLPAQRAQVQKKEQLAAVLAAAPQTFQVDRRVKEADCQLQGALPDHACSPGAIFEDATKEIICVPGYTKTVRSVSTNMRKKVFAEYNISWPQPFGSYEVDHIIPLALGGSNDIANLFPEARQPQPGFQEKDVVENYLHEHVCSGEINLDAAQVQIANDWLAVYNNLTPEVIKDYKTRYKTWAPN